VRAPIATAHAARRFFQASRETWSFEEQTKTQEGDPTTLNAWWVAAERENPMVPGSDVRMRTGRANQQRPYRFVVEPSNVTSTLVEARVGRREVISRGAGLPAPLQGRRTPTTTAMSFS
jgi:hypothetical protein